MEKTWHTTHHTIYWILLSVGFYDLYQLQTLVSAKVES
jgi:hypothetical protein